MRSPAAGIRVGCRTRTGGPADRAPDAARRARRGCRSAPGTPTEASRSHLGGQLRVLAQLALEHADLVGDEALDRPLDVDDLGAAAIPGEDPRVGDLTAGLRVEGRPVQHDAEDVARAGHVRTVLA